MRVRRIDGNFCLKSYTRLDVQAREITERDLQAGIDTVRKQVEFSGLPISQVHPNVVPHQEA